MLELILCSLLTILPDYLFRHYWQGKRIGHEITLFSVWYELRWGITACIMLTVLLVTIIFYNHPSTTKVTSLFRTVPILPEAAGRVSEIFVELSDEVKPGQRLFKLDSAKQEAALEVAKRRIAEVDASMVMAAADIEAAAGQIRQAQGLLQQALDDLRTKEELQARNSGTVAAREIERLKVSVEGNRGAVAAAEAAKKAAETKLSTLLPAEKASAEAQLQQAQVDLDKTVIYAGVGGRVEQFVLKVGDYVNPIMRPAGILIPTGSGTRGIQAGFGQIEAQVIKVGMSAEVTCVSKPLSIIPMVVTDVQDYIATGQFGAGEKLVDLQQTKQPGTILVFMEPMFKGGIDDIPPGSACIANAYTNNHHRLLNEKMSGFQRIYLHIVDTVALVHGIILRAQALLLPVQNLVFKGH